MACFAAVLRALSLKLTPRQRNACKLKENSLKSAKNPWLCVVLKGKYTILKTQGKQNSEIIAFVYLCDLCV